MTPTLAAVSARLPRLPRLVLIGALYILAGKLGLMLALVHPGATAVWPSTGITLAALLLFGYGVWPGHLCRGFPGQPGHRRLGGDVARHRQWKHARGAGGRLPGEPVRERAPGVPPHDGHLPLRAARRPGQHHDQRHIRGHEPSPPPGSRPGPNTGASGSPGGWATWGRPGGGAGADPGGGSPGPGALGSTGVAGGRGVCWPCWSSWDWPPSACCRRSTPGGYSLKFVCMPVLIWIAFRFDQRTAAPPPRCCFR